MSDTDLRTTAGHAAQNLNDKLQQAGKEVTKTASEALSSASDAARDKLNELGGVARDTATQAADMLKTKVGEQQHAGADYAQRLADNIRNAAHAFESDTPLAARTMETAADFVDSAAGKIRDGSLGEVIDGMTSFARRQPAAFLGLSVLAGFAAVRFLKASSAAGTSAQASVPSRAAAGGAS
jgi:ABC-type transporter Mla subunit MlaD